MNGPTPVVRAARGAFLDAFAWDGGHADVWRAFEDGPTLAAVVAGLIDPWRDDGVTAVVAVESRGFLLGGAVAVGLGVGFHAVRKVGALFPGEKHVVVGGPDYRGVRHRLTIRATLTPSDRVLVVDDWAEKGAQALAARELVERCGATWAGLSLVVDQLSDDVRTRLDPVAALVTADELGPAE